MIAVGERERGQGRSMREKERDRNKGRKAPYAGLSFEKSPLKSSIVPSTVPTRTIGWLNLCIIQHTNTLLAANPLLYYWKLQLSMNFEAKFISANDKILLSWEFLF